MNIKTLEKQLTVKEYGLPLYHGTTEKKAKDILEQGLFPRKSIESHYPKEKFIFVESNLEKAFQWGCRSKGDIAVIRILEVPPKCKVSYDVTIGWGESAYKIGKCAIPPKYLNQVNPDELDQLSCD